MKQSNLIIIVVLAIAVLGLGTYSIMSYYQLKTIPEVSVKQTEQPSATESTPSVSEQISDQGLCTKRARVHVEYEYNPDSSIRSMAYSVSVDGSTFSASKVQELIREATVSLDCLRVAWVVEQKDSWNESGTQIKPDLVRIMPLAGGAIQEFTLSTPGPAELHPFVGNQLVVSIGTPGLREYDVPQESDLEGNFYQIDISTEKMEAIGGPYITVSPNFQFIVRRLNNTISLQSRDGKSSVVLADYTKNEYATDFYFSPDSQRLAYLLLQGDKGLIFGKLFRPVGPDITEEIIHGELLVRSVPGPSVEKVQKLISGGYTVDSFRVDRWISSTILEWTEPETTKRVWQKDVTTDERAKKNGLIDLEAI